MKPVFFSFFKYTILIEDSVNKLDFESCPTITKEVREYEFTIYKKRVFISFEK